MPRAVVRNAGDPDQVKAGRRHERNAQADERRRLKAVMATPEGRATLAALLERAGIYRSVFAHDAGTMAYLAGRQDFGHELLALLIQADPVAHEQMEQEARVRQRQQDAATDAAHIAPASDAGADV